MSKGNTHIPALRRVIVWEVSEGGDRGMEEDGYMKGRWRGMEGSWKGGGGRWEMGDGGGMEGEGDGRGWGSQKA